MKFSSLNCDVTPEQCSPVGAPVVTGAPDKSRFSTTIQLFTVIVLAGFGNVLTGIILDKVQGWEVFLNLTEMFVLVPSLLGLKGNLEMTMASRLSTQANLGHMQDWKTTLNIVRGNLCLIQSQATVVAFLASLIATVINVYKDGGEFRFTNALVLCASSLITANVACFLLGACMVLVVIISHRYRIDPDNVATPIAASLGDVTTMLLLAAFSQFIYSHTSPNKFPILAGGTVVVFISLLPLWFFFAYKNKYTTSVVTTGWSPVLLAMLISSGAGLLLDYGAGKFKRLAIFQPVINGVGGNVVAIQASRLSTYLHRSGKLGHLPLGHTVFTNPVQAFLDKKDINIKTARLLLFMAFPAHILCTLLVKLIQEEVRITPIFLITYILFSLLQVVILLYLAYNLVFLLWKKEVDPDNSSIPILTATGDFLGSVLLLAVFMILSLLGDHNATAAGERH